MTKAIPVDWFQYPRTMRFSTRLRRQRAYVYTPGLRLAIGLSLALDLVFLVGLPLVFSRRDALLVVRHDPWLGEALILGFFGLIGASVGLSRIVDLRRQRFDARLPARPAQTYRFQTQAPVQKRTALANWRLRREVHAWPAGLQALYVLTPMGFFVGPTFIIFTTMFGQNRALSISACLLGVAGLAVAWSLAGLVYYLRVRRFEKRHPRPPEKSLLSGALATFGQSRAIGGER